MKAAMEDRTPRSSGETEEEKNKQKEKKLKLAKTNTSYTVMKVCNF